MALRGTATDTNLRLLAQNLLNRNYSTYLAGASGGGLVRMVPRAARRRVVLMPTRPV